MAPPDHAHAEECRTLARARIMALRAQTRLNERISEALRRHDADLLEIIAFLERRVMRANVASLFLTPPRLERQTAATPLFRRASN